eukprot:5714715-Amphidinium_carterae.1
MEVAHRPHHLEPAPREHPLEAVSGDIEGRDCAHRSDATIRKRSFEGVCEDTEAAHGQHRLDAPRERPLEAVCGDIEGRDCAHHSDAALWKFPLRPNCWKKHWNDKLQERKTSVSLYLFETFQTTKPIT